ncbi:hypothetical protein MAPG_10648 [Magnaporthiopsis poae ATCC 64411]|uniref:Uncharacterized protein n=1 Tax=Magnaporthiopsis poae (strain ATCC 64411 / 73-15) TaxID=644358 RepID=A0A0C4ED55_MAGP6|nr:hypothetical protein MAPG_10648 [Magnaporthiopsis poae ATCC 64411]
MDEDPCSLLAAQAASTSGVIFRAGLKPREASYHLAYDVATKLHLISGYIGSLPPYWIGPDVEQLCRALLRDLTTERLDKAPANPFLFAFPFGRNSAADRVARVATFFRTRTDEAGRLQATCDELLARLTNEDDAEGQRLPDSVLQRRDGTDDSAHIHDGIYEALEMITKCDLESHGDGIPANDRSARDLRHPAKLCLHESCQTDSYASFNVRIFVSGMNMNIWQEFCLRAHQQVQSATEDYQKPLSRGGFCRTLERDITARLFLSFKDDCGLVLLNDAEVPRQILESGNGESLASVLHNYELTPRDKVVLAYAVARAYWQYYDSNLMRTKWTSESIRFMHEKGGRGHEGQLPLCAYLSFPFGVPSNPSDDVLYEDMLSHRCPRIFDIAVLLLEIGLGKPFRSANKQDPVAQANFNHKIATDQLLELHKASWDGFTNKPYFDGAVKFCFNGENFIPTSKQPRTSRQGVVVPTPPMTASERQEGIRFRRRAFYKNVVRPLEWLAKTGFMSQTGDMTYVSKKQKPLDGLALADAARLPEPEALFHSAIVPKMWLDDLKKISRQVEQKRRLAKDPVTRRIRVAILDTGFNRGLPVFEQKTSLLGCIAEEKDFVDGAPTVKDEFGHGTFMARLVMECAPGAEILVARVARNTKELGESKDRIRQAILWAGQPGKADIISMSFGFPTEDEGIREAIEMVQRERKEKIIFLASAGNSSSDDESFPARHPSVISVYATNCHGTFLESNSESTSRGASIIGTFGDNIPDSMCDEFSTVHPGICKPGSSVATAVMAGIGATMLAYATALPSLLGLQGRPANACSRVLGRLWTAQGMEALLYRLGPENKDFRRRRAVKPMWFWKNRPDDMKRCWGICEAVSDVESRSPTS